MMKKKTSVTPKKSVKNAVPDSPMQIGLLHEIVKLMASNDLNTVEVRDGDKRIIVRRGAMTMPMAMPMPVATAAPAADKPAEDADLVPIKSPMVGTFYALPSPDAKPYVSIGSVISEETDVCIIEAMKVFNNIKAECKGTIAKILATNGQTVEFGQTLFLVKP